jgi:hypothetical protein
LITALWPAEGVADLAEDLAAADPLALVRADAGGALRGWMPVPVAAIDTPEVDAPGVAGVRAPCARNGIIA